MPIKPIKILMIDDDEFIRKIYSSDWLERGWQVSLAADGEEGLAKIITEKPDIVILDVIMPKKNGFEVLTELKERGLISQIPVIVFSHLVQTEDQAKARSLGAVDYLNKDTTNFESMYQAIASHIPIATTV
jgi:CheY-like chemotaxis protein